AGAVAPEVDPERVQEVAAEREAVAVRIEGAQRRAGRARGALVHGGAPMMMMPGDWAAPIHRAARDRPERNARPPMGPGTPMSRCHTIPRRGLTRQAKFASGQFCTAGAFLPGASNAANRLY